MALKISFGDDSSASNLILVITASNATPRLASITPYSCSGFSDAGGTRSNIGSLT